MLLPETNYGVTPATPAAKVKNITGTSLALTRGKIESGTIRPDRQVSDVRLGNRQIGGEIGVELAWGDFDDMLEAVLCGTWEDGELLPGTTRRSFTALRQFTDIDAGGNPVHRFPGLEFNTLSISIAPEKIVEMTFGCFARELIMQSALPTGIVISNPSGAKPFDSFSGALFVDDVQVGNVTEIAMTIENGIEPRFVVFNDKSNRPKIGKCRVTGTLTTYFENSSMLIAFNGGIKRKLNFELADNNGNVYQFELPSILPTSGGTDVKGEDDITIPVAFSATVGDAGAAHALLITRLES